MVASIRTATARIWILGSIAALLSIASAFSYFLQMGQGIIVGALLGLPGREGDVAVAQHRAAYWFLTSLLCLIASVVTATTALPFFANASRPSRLIGRFILASIFSVVFTVLIGIVAIVAFDLITTLHRAH
jgi:hypothetical protein